MNPRALRQAPPDALAYSLEDGAARIGIGKSLFYELVNAGEIKTFKVGRSRRVSRAALEAFIRRKEKAA